MRNSFLPLILVAIGLIASSCVSNCLAACKGHLNLQVKDTSGRSLSEFTGQVSMAGTVFELHCGPHATSDSGRISCKEGGVEILLEGFDAPESVGVSLATSDGVQTFEGEVRMSAVQVHEVCGNECETANATVVME